MGWNGDGDFGAILSKGPGQWKDIPLWRLTWSDILQCMQVTSSDEIFLPSRKYDCPAHIISIIRDYDITRESQRSRPFGSHDEYNCICRNRKLWKLMTIIWSCIAAERLELEGRDVASPPVSVEELLRLPGPVFCPTRTHLYVGFRYQGANRMMRLTGTDSVNFGPKYWDIGLLILWSEPDEVQRKKRECIIQLRTIQAAHGESTGKDRDVYGLVTSGDMVQIHRLAGCREVRSSPMFLLTAEGVPGIWPYLRDIIHETQMKAPPPEYIPQGPRIQPKYYQEEEILLRRGYGFEPDGTKQQRFAESTSPAAKSAIRNKEIREMTRFDELRTAESDVEIVPEDSLGEERYWTDNEPEPYYGKKGRTRLYKTAKEIPPSKAGGFTKQEQEDWDIL